MAQSNDYELDVSRYTLSTTESQQSSPRGYLVTYTIAPGTDEYTDVIDAIEAGKEIIITGLPDVTAGAYTLRPGKLRVEVVNRTYDVNSGRLIYVQMSAGGYWSQAPASSIQNLTINLYTDGNIANGITSRIQTFFHT